VRKVKKSSNPNVITSEMPVSEEGFKGGDRTSIDLPKPEEALLEALAATAIGLAAAIPATVAYNRLGASLARAGQQLQHLIEEDAVTITAARSASHAAEVR
jgi:hypothetical protein